MPSPTVNTPRMKIQDLPLIPAINGTEKIPTGGFGDYAVSISQLKTFIGGGSGGGSSRLIDLTDVIATTPTVGKFLRELPTVNSVRRFAFEDFPDKPFTVGDWDMRPTSSVTYSVTAGAAIVDGTLTVVNRPALPFDEASGAPYMVARAALVPPLNIKISVPTSPSNAAFIGIHRNSITILDQLATLQAGGTPTDTLLYTSGSPSFGYQTLLTVNGTTNLLNNAVVDGEISISISEDYALTIAGQTYQLTQQSCETFSIASYGMDRDSVGDIPLSAYVTDGASIPTGAKSGDVFKVTHGGSFGGATTKANDFVQLYDNKSKIITTRLPSDATSTGGAVAAEINTSLQSGGAINTAIAASSTTTLEQAASSVATDIVAAKHDVFARSAVAYHPIAGALPKDGLYAIFFDGLSIGGVSYPKNSFLTKVGSTYQPVYNYGDSVWVQSPVDGNIFGRYIKYDDFISTEWLLEGQNWVEYNGNNLLNYIYLPKQFDKYRVTFTNETLKIVFGNSGGYLGNTNTRRTVILNPTYSGTIPVRFETSSPESFTYYSSGTGVTNNSIGYVLGVTAGEQIELTFDHPHTVSGSPSTKVYLTVKRFI